MKNIKELKSAIKNNIKLVWNDPDRIKNNDYSISWIEDIDVDKFDEYTPILIKYNNGKSETQVYLSEIVKVK